MNVLSTPKRRSRLLQRDLEDVIIGSGIVCAERAGTWFVFLATKGTKGTKGFRNSFLCFGSGSLLNYTDWFTSKFYDLYGIIPPIEAEAPKPK